MPGGPPRIPPMAEKIQCMDSVARRSACLRDLPTPAEAPASRRREPLRWGRLQRAGTDTGTLFSISNLVEKVNAQKIDPTPDTMKWYSQKVLLQKL
jgi:hypothetical protein